ncbi:MAG: transposase, partial [Peptococcaceae bacterium]|nr:transposase [Peptococcaceae bacterium]
AESVSLTMQRICSGFVYWYNWKYDRLGHLFQERYKSEVVEDERYLLTVLRYIHQNPIKAGLTNTLEEYQWSSYQEYIHKPKMIDAEFILELFDAEKLFLPTLSA